MVLCTHSTTFHHVAGDRDPRRKAEAVVPQRFVDFAEVGEITPTLRCRCP